MSLLLSPLPNHKEFNTRMLRWNYQRVHDAMDVLVPGEVEAERVFATRAPFSLLEGAVVVQYPSSTPNLKVEQTAEVKVSLTQALARITIGDFRDSNDVLVRCDSLSVWDEQPLKPADGGPLEGLAVEVLPSGLHTLAGIVNGTEITLPGAYVHHADNVAVAYITFLECISGT